MQNLILGLTAAGFLGIAVGCILGLTPVLCHALTPIVEFMRAVPAVTVLPIALLLLGLSPEARISVVVYGSIWPILLNTIDGVRSVDPVVLDVAQSYRVPRWRRLILIVLPAASPQIMAGLRTALSLGITLIVLSELFGSTNGIGYSILQAQRDYEPTGVWAGILLLGIVGYGANMALRVVESILLGWHRQMIAGQR
ncbi:ABC transporter permease [Rhodococcoides yunnanense]|uniref:ABC transporter permease n=1 Tax=Rhodococcoides yunnanense TaxID=278209 RepID=UPI001C3FEAFA|nr:ABC transporter permease subunit [Rhodococcus yunnanensis]